MLHRVASWLQMRAPVVVGGAAAAVLAGGVVAVALHGGGADRSGTTPATRSIAPAVPETTRPASAKPSATPTAPAFAGSAPPSSPTSVVAYAALPTVGIYESPSASEPQRTLDDPQPSGSPLVFLVRERQLDWIEVLLPVRPNGSTGWVRQADVTLYEHDYAVVVELRTHRVTVFKAGETLLQEPAGIGTSNTPTPGGLYYLKELLKPPDPNGTYGPYAFGLSGFSNVLTSFGGGEGVIGLHGTNDPSGLGKDVSAGCIRIDNDAISRLAAMLPLGTPVEIRP